MATPSPALIDAMRSIDAALKAGEFLAAHDQLAALVEEQPGFVEALRLYAGTKQALGDIDGAERILRKAFDFDPNWAPTLAALGELLLSRGNVAEAEPLLRRAAQRLPRAALVLARHYNDTQRAGDAFTLLAPSSAGGKADADLIVQYVAAAAALGRLAEVVASLGQLSQAKPDDLGIAQSYAITLDAANRPADSEHIATQTIARGHRNAVLYQIQARSLVAVGEFDRAETALRECLRLDPLRSEAHDHLARLVWMRTGDAAQATSALDDALRTFAADPALRAAKAAILQGAGDARGAYACLVEQAGHPQASPALLVRAGLAALDFDPALSLPFAERAVRAMPANTAARSLLVAALLGIGDAQAALPHCETLRTAAPDDQYFIALQTMAWRLLDNPRHREYCDYARWVLPQRLEAPAPWPDLANFFADLERSLDRLHNPHGHPLLFQSLRHGTETTADLSRSDDPAIRALFAAFDAPIRRYLEHIRNGPEPLRRRDNGSYRYNGSWSVRLRSSGFHTNHVHPRGWISSACYIELPDVAADAHQNAGCLTFGRPSLITTPALQAEHVVRPEVGMLVLFPSYFWHGTVPFASERTRLTVAFDVVPER
ncbi:2OG-Fe(II) oxygenase family protein [Rudaea sp.]|uniref:2OG-Fe(II) oxygenase family protein n=1 Tax=Rudaea sp. TaxID=2136325 RepID=UPI002ED155C7